MGSATPDTPSVLAVTSVRIERETLARFKSIAEANQRTVSQQLRWLIDRAIEDHERPQEAAA